MPRHEFNIKKGIGNYSALIKDQAKIQTRFS